jgi:restriction system protein
MARRRSLWTELQRDMARRHRLAEQARQRNQQAAARAAREHERAIKAAQRQRAATERERKQLYIETRKDEASDMVAELAERLEEIETVLVTGIRTGSLLTFAELRKTPAVSPFDPGDVGRPIPGPNWGSYAPPAPTGFGRMLGGDARYQRKLAAAQEAFEVERTRRAAMEGARLRELATRRKAYDQQLAQAQEAVADHNAGIDQFEADYRGRDPEAVAEFCTLVLESSDYPEGFPRRTRVLFRPDPGEIVVECELPPQSLIPANRDFKYVQTRDEITATARPLKEIKERYAQLIAKVALRVIHEIFVSVATSVVEVVTFSGHVSTTDPATGQPIRPCLLSASAKREDFTAFRLADLDPVACLRRLNALVSPHPFDLEPVRPVVDFETLLTQYKFVEGMDVIAGLDSRPDLLDMTPTEFEHLVRQIFEAMGMKSWKTQDIKDDGVDAVAVNENPVFGGLCIIQAKRYRNAVGVHAIRELAGVMEDKHATTGILVTTSWVTKDGHEFKSRHGRIQIFECEELTYLCKEHLGLDVLISLPKRPPPRHRAHG